MCSLVRLTSCSTSETTLWEVYVMVSWNQIKNEANGSSRRDVIFSPQKKPYAFISFIHSHFSLPSWMILSPEIVQYMYVYVFSYSPFSCSSIFFIWIWSTKLCRHFVSFWQFWDNYPLHSLYELNVWLHLASILFLIESLTVVWFKVLPVIIVFIQCQFSGVGGFLKKPGNKQCLCKQGSKKPSKSWDLLLYSI